jgi:protein phosphatase
MFFFKTKKQHIAVFAETDIGKKRETNQDSVASLVINSKDFNKEFNCGILVVADGMGGLEKGELASQIASKKFLEVAQQNIKDTLRDNNSPDFDKILRKSVDAANREVWTLSENESSPVGTTIVGAIVMDDNVYIANVGDSRAYLINPRKSILQITKDHSVVQEMVDAKIITREKARTHSKRNIITKALGLEKDVVPDIYHEDLKKDNILMLCSDGLYGMIEDKEISNTMNGDITKSAEKLISLANKHGGIDNISIALAGYKD